MKKKCPENGENTTTNSTNETQPEQQQDLAINHEIQSPGRRQFLSAAGGLTATTILSSVTAESGTRANAQKPPQPLQARRERALEIRKRDAVFQLSRDFPLPQNNGDENIYPTRFANFTKSLPHNDLGEVDQKAYLKFLQAVSSGLEADFAQIPLGGTVQLANPQSAFAFNLEGVDPQSQVVEAPPGFATEEFAAEVAECYWLALTRDIPFSQYGKEPLTAAAIDDLRRFSDFRNINAGNLFRADYPGVQIGPYISQFLLQPFPLGSTSVAQRYRTTIAGSDHLTAYQTWLDLQNGSPAQSPEMLAATPTYIYNGRVLGEFVHNNFPYQVALVAALILLSYGDDALDASNPYLSLANQSGFVTFGGPHILDLTARVANHAMKTAYYSKWVVHRRIRPEEVGGRIHNHMMGTARYPLNSKLLDSPAFASVFSKYGTYLCPQAFPEGCPTHPSYPGGNATFTAAAVTTLKAFFNEDFVIPNPVVPSDDGLSLLPWKGEPLTVGNELNKLVFNAAFGRNTAGVHFRRDELQGILLGETAAFSVMTDFNSTYNEDFGGFSLSSFEGTPMTLSANPAA
jgi:hypothetical protein